MRNGRPNIEELTAAFTAALPELDDGTRRVALATYRHLAQGVPLSPEEIAEAAGADVEEVRRTLSGWIGVYTDEAKWVIGFWGLAIPRMKHRFEVDGVTLHAWCAFDTLFLPELLGRTARVESACEASGQPVRLMVSPARVESAEPASLFVSFLAPDVSRLQQDVIRNFCHYVHFFRSREDGQAWTAKAPGTFLLTLDEAVELARRTNDVRFGALLERRAVS